MSRWGEPMRLRWSPVDGPELWCKVCGEWWSVGEDAAAYWQINRWSACRACMRERWRVAERLRALDPDYRAKRAARVRRYKAEFMREYPELAVEYNAEMKRRERARARERLAEKRRDEAA